MGCKDQERSGVYEPYSFLGQLYLSVYLHICRLHLGNLNFLPSKRIKSYYKPSKQIS
jgi:hypothetical protein